jgi:hypothetical protein
MSGDALQWGVISTARIGVNSVIPSPRSRR